MTDKTINLKPFHCEHKPEAGGFALEFWCATDGGKRVKVRLHMEFWWVRFIAREMWAVIKRRQEEVEEAKKALNGN